jgi:hypothetical protein
LNIYFLHFETDCTVKFKKVMELLPPLLLPPYPGLAPIGGGGKRRGGEYQVLGGISLSIDAKGNKKRLISCGYR